MANLQLSLCINLASNRPKKQNSLQNTLSMQKNINTPADAMYCNVYVLTLKCTIDVAYVTWHGNEPLPTAILSFLYKMQLKRVH